MYKNLILVLLLSGCASVSNLRNAPISEGTSFSVKANLKDSFNAATQAATICSLSIEEGHEQDSSFMIIAHHTATAFSWGERVRIVGERSADETIIRVIAKPKLATNITADSERFKSCIWDKMRSILKS